MKKICLLLYITGVIFGNTYIYRETVTNNTYVNRIEVASDSLSYKQHDNSTTLVLKYNSRGEAYYSLVKALNEGTYIVVTRNQNEMTFSGKYQHQPVLKTIQLDNRPWYGSYFTMSFFVKFPKKEQDYYMAMGYNQSVMKLRLIKEQQEKISINGTSYMAQKIRITLPDWRSIMWSSYAWFRVSDGLLLKTEELRGPPGSPLWKTELIDEKS